MHRVIQSGQRLAHSQAVANTVKASQVTSASHQQRRHLSLHEYQSIQLMQNYGVQCPAGRRAKLVSEAEDAAAAIAAERPNAEYVVKAQVLAGGRGLGHFKESGFQGGVHICDTPAKVRELAEKMLGKTLVTKQTGEAGKPCNALFICERLNLKTEKYFAILLDRTAQGPLLIGSAVGGTSIEDIAAKDPSAIVKMPVELSKGLTDNDAKSFARKLGFDGEALEDAVKCIKGLFQMFVERDCTMVEVNPFAETADGRVMVCDAKVNFDDNAEFRQREIFEKRDMSQEDPREVQAAKADLNYVGLDGNLGCMVNGAGLAMATMDLIKLEGGEPANFLDVGGGATKEQVEEALRILQNDPKVSAVLVNIFGGIMRCDTIAQGLISAFKELGFSKPLIVRLDGTNQEQAKRLIDEAGVQIVYNSDLGGAARDAVMLAKMGQLGARA